MFLSLSISPTFTIGSTFELEAVHSAIELVVACHKPDVFDLSPSGADRFVATSWYSWSVVMK